MTSTNSTTKPSYVIPFALDPGIVRSAPGATRAETLDHYLAATHPADEPAAVGDLTSDLAAELAAEEHRQGLVTKARHGHCPDCDNQARADAQARRQRDCPHDTTVELSTLGGYAIAVICRDCGTRFTPEGAR